MSNEGHDFKPDKLIHDHFSRIQATLRDNREGNWTRAIIQRVIDDEIDSIGPLVAVKMNKSLSGGDRESAAFFIDDLFISISTFPCSIEEAKLKHYSDGYLPYLDRMVGYGWRENPRCHWIHFQFFWDGNIFWTRFTLFPNKDTLDFTPMYILPIDLLSDTEKKDTGLINPDLKFRGEKAKVEISSITVCAVSKKEILAGDTSHVIRAIDEKVSEFLRLDQELSDLPVDAKQAQAVKLIQHTKRVRFSISGYDEDPRPLWAFDETRQWAWTWLRKQPYCLPFLEDEDCLLLSLLCLGGFKSHKYNGFIPNFGSGEASEFESILSSSFGALVARYGNPLLLGAFALARGTSLITQFNDMKSETIKAPRSTKGRWWQFWKN